ncbi:hypothetical protein HOD19_00895 [bacterium]|jgi:hypothetical protein|nr:hypothetical protein [bacterium]MBT4649276.1 hypothetical protein [bacterium]
MADKMTENIQRQLPNLLPVVVKKELPNPKPGEVWRVQLRDEGGNVVVVSLLVFSDIEGNYLADDFPYGIAKVPCMLPQGAVKGIPLFYFVEQVKKSEEEQIIE